MSAPTRPSDKRPPDQAVLGFLREWHDAEPTGLEVLSGGFWSAAFGYAVDGDEFVLRLSDRPDGFRDDEAAMAYSSVELPVPEVLDIGEAFDRWFAISRRHHGRVLEEIGPEEAGALGPTVVGLLAALRAVPDSGRQTMGWADWLRAGITDAPGHFTSGWRGKLAEHSSADQTFRAATARIESTLDVCVDRRELVHGDLLHANVLISPAADAVTAVFSWKCSTWGDALYDLAWCTFWGRWHDGIGALDVWDRVVPTLPAADRSHIAERHHAYELHVGASHLGWYATLDDLDSLRWTADQLDELLEHGPRPLPS